MMSTQEITTAEKIRLLPWSVGTTAANTVFVQFVYFGSVFVLFLNELGQSNAQIGAILSIFPFLGIIAVFIAPMVARFGYKRTWLLFWGIRKTITILLLFVPWILTQFGSHAAFIYVAFIVIGFGLCRAIAETAAYPWKQEYIPNSIRGKFYAINSIVGSVVGIVAITIASFVVEQGDGLGRFMILFAAGIAFGYIALWASSHIPGGASIKDTQVGQTSYRDMIIPLRDRNFILFIAGLGLMNLAIVPMFSFLPLFMKETVGLTEGNVVLLPVATLVGALSATYLIGWSSDRYGSKPIMLLGVWLTILLPIGWLLIPRAVSISIIIALAIAFVQGIAHAAWTIGSTRLLFVDIVPTEEKTEYMAVFYAAAGLVGGMSQLIGGRILDATTNLSGQFLIFTIDSFTPLFVLGFFLPFISLLLFRYVRADSSVTMKQFIGLFLHGNPLAAFGTMILYYRAQDERTTLLMTERMGQAHSPLTMEEMLDGLKDPRFNVRFEVVITIARSEPDPRFVEALSQILHGTEISLSVIAAWALGRIGDARAIEALRKGLDSKYHSIQAHCARALGTLDDTTIIPLLLKRMETETDKGLQMAYSSALGSLQASEATETLLEVLDTTENEGARLEIAVSLTRIMGNEPFFIKLLRDIREDMGTASSKVVSDLKKRLLQINDNHVFATIIDECADLLARNDAERGFAKLGELVSLLPENSLANKTDLILTHSIKQLQKYGTTHIEYLLLVLCALIMKASESRSPI